MKALLLAARPKTLPAAVVPVWLGCVLAYHLKDTWSPFLAICTLLSAICIQIATNLFNDAIDAQKGSDTEKRLGPVRVTAGGLLSSKTVFTWAGVFLALSCLFGLPLVFERGWIIIAIGLPSLYLSYGYTGGKFPLAYLGLGELFVFLFFGLVSTMGTYFVQTGEWNAQSCLLGAIVGWLSCFLIGINNLRDAEEDSSTGKRTLTVRITPSLYKRLMFIMGAHCSLAILALWWWLELKVGLEIVFLICAWVLLNLVLMTKDPSKMNKFLALCGILLIAFGVIFQVSILSSN